MLKNRFIMSLLVAGCATAMTVQATTVTQTDDGVTVTTTIGDDTNTTTTQKEVYGTVENYQNKTSGDYKPGVQTGFTNSVIKMTGGTVTSRLAGFARNNPVSGNVNIEVTGGEAAAVFGGYLYSYASKHPNGYFAVSELDMPDSINIVVGGDAKVGQIRGGVNNGSTKNSTLEERSVSVGSVAITIKDNATIGTDPSDDAIRAGGGAYCSVKDGIQLNIEGGSIIGDVYAGVRGAGTTAGYTEVNMSGGTLDGNLYAGSSLDDGAGSENSTVKGDTKINISGGTVTKNVFGGGYNTQVGGNTSVTVSGGTVEGNVYGGAEGGTVGGNTEVVIDGGDVVGNVYGAGKGDIVKGGSKVRLLAGNVGGVVDAGGEGSTVEGESIIEVGTEEKPYEGTVGGVAGFDRMVVAKGSYMTLSGGNVFETKNHSFTLNAGNMSKAALTLGSGASIIVAPGDAITLTILSDGPLAAGKYMIIDGSAIGTTGKGRATTVPGTVDLSGWSAGTVTVEGDVAGFDDLVWDEENNILYLVLTETVVPVVVTEPHPSIDAAVLSGWGVFQSTQAFTSTLWGPRSNAVELAPTTTTDAKGRVIGTEPAAAKGRTIAWGTAYAHDSRIGSVGADYSVYGAAIGTEYRFAKNGSSIGLAFGYDWGKVKPFSTTSVDQHTAHASVYGRAGEWKVSEKGSVALDMAASYGHTESSHADFGGDWSQDSWQLDMRASYLHALSERTTASAFVGAQYYTHEDDKVDGLVIDSMQNMRLMVGGGVSHIINRATVFGEVALHYDTLRHNPNVKEQDNRYKCSNPGRFGGSIGGGVSYQVKDNFNVFGTYTFSGADDSLEHNFNLGASVSF